MRDKGTKINKWSLSRMTRSTCMLSFFQLPFDMEFWKRVAQLRIHLQCRRLWFNSWVRKIPWGRDRLCTPVFLGYPGGSDGKESACNAGDLGSIPGLGWSLGRGDGNPFQYSCLENPHGQRSLAGYSPWSHKELDMTEQLSTAQHKSLIKPWALKERELYFILLCLLSHSKG